MGIDGGVNLLATPSITSINNCNSYNYADTASLSESCNHVPLATHDKDYHPKINTCKSRIQQKDDTVKDPNLTHLSII